MSEEGKDFQFLCFDVRFFFFLVVVCLMFHLEILDYILPSCTPTQTHQSLLGLHGFSQGYQSDLHFHPFHLIFQAGSFFKDEQTGYIYIFCMCIEPESLPTL